jgi:XTP/dITP diphosphohydrolase
MLEDIDIQILSLRDFLDIPEIEEDGETFFENSLIKAKTISQTTGQMVLADDSGLEVDCLGGRPGIRSSRYAGEMATDESNIKKLLDQLKGVPSEQRGASFRCVLVLYRPDGSFKSFEGELRGRINEEPVGNGGFGYDPVFFVPERKMTVAQLPLMIKNGISHRSQAVKKVKKWLQQGNIFEQGK